MKKIIQLICNILCGKQQEVKKPETLLTYKEVVEMLQEYDNTRFEVLVNELGYEDSRVNTFEFSEVKNYVNYAEKRANEIGIKLKGLSFIKGVYNANTAHDYNSIGYENLLYMPTALIEGKEVLIDIVNSKRDNIVTFKEMLEQNGYKWRYSSRENYILRKKIEKSDKEKQMFKSIRVTNNDEDQLSGTANVTNIAPPYELQ